MPAGLPHHERIRREFGAKLRTLRRGIPLTGPELAAALGVNQSTVSRVETGERVPSEAYLIGLTRAAGLGQAEARSLADEGREIANEAGSWRLLHRAGIARFQEHYEAIEADAASVRIFHVALIPGLVQTPDYARSVIGKATGVTGQELEEAVAARIQRQAVLFDQQKRFGFVVLESSLRLGIVPAAVMAGQAERLHTLSGMPNIEVGVVPFGVEIPLVPLNGFIVFGDDTVVGETTATELTLRDPRDVRRHIDLYEAMSSVAMKGDAVRAWLSEFARSAAVTAGA